MVEEHEIDHHYYCRSYCKYTSYNVYFISYVLFGGNKWVSTKTDFTSSEKLLCSSFNDLFYVKFVSKLYWSCSFNCSCQVGTFFWKQKGAGIIMSAIIILLSSQSSLYVIVSLANYRQELVSIDSSYLLCCKKEILRILIKITWNQSLLFESKAIWVVKMYCFYILFLYFFQIVIYFIVSAACGGLDWPCTRKK